MIEWEFEQTISGAIVFPKLWNSSGILISISNLTPPPWRKVGTLKIEALIDGEYFKAQIKPVEYGKQLIEIPYNAYRITFEPVETLLISYPNISIKIAEFDLNMYISSPSVPEKIAGAPIYNSITPTAPTSAAPIFQIAPPRARSSALITNRTNRVLYLKEGTATDLPTLTAADPFVSVPAGGSYTVSNWDGEIVGIMAANFANGGKIIVKELPYV